MIRWFTKSDLQEEHWKRLKLIFAGMYADAFSYRVGHHFLVNHYTWDYPWILKRLGEVALDATILDAGGGKGMLQYYLARMCNVVNVDRDPKDLSIDRCNKLFGTDVQFVAGDLCQLDFPDGHFDYIVSCSSIEHNSFEKAKQLLRELSRVLKEGGKCIFTIVGWIEDLGLNRMGKDEVVEVYTQDKIASLLEAAKLDPGSDTNVIEEKDLQRCIAEFYQQFPGYHHSWVPVGISAVKCSEGRDV